MGLKYDEVFRGDFALFIGVVGFEPCEEGVAVVLVLPLDGEEEKNERMLLCFRIVTFF